MPTVKRPVCRCRGTQRQKLNINGMFAQSAIFNRIYNKKVYHIRGKTATPSSAHDQICVLRGKAAKIHFMVGASSFPQNALRWRFVGALFYLLWGPLPCFVLLFLIDLLTFSVHFPHAVGATPSSSHDQICLLRGKAAKIHFMVGASSFPQNALRWRFVGALFSGISDVYLFTFSLTFSFLPLVDLLAFFVHIPHAVGATPCGRPNQWENFHFAAVHRRLLSPASNHALFRSFCPWSICPLFLCVFRMP